MASRMPTSGSEVVRFMRSHLHVRPRHPDATLGLPVTDLAPSSYMENLCACRGDTISCTRARCWRLRVCGGRVGFIAAKDVAHVAAEVLTSDGHEDAMYVLTGPEALSYADVAARISAVFAREVDDEEPASRGCAKAPAGQRADSVAGRGHARDVRLDPGWRLGMGDRDGARGDRNQSPTPSRTGRRSGAVPSSGGRRVCPHQPFSLPRRGQHDAVQQTPGVAFPGAIEIWARITQRCDRPAWWSMQVHQLLRSLAAA